jgi:ribosome-associated toxin RatA of RatAB toxin-antitoxin module
VPIVEAKTEIAAPQDALFDLAQDYALRLRWDPSLREMKFLGGAAEAAVGVRVWVRAKNGLSMEVVYLTLDRPRSVAMKMTSGPRMFERFAGSWRFEPVAGGGTRVTFRYGFETRVPLLRPLLDRVVMRIFMRDIERRLQGLKHAAENTDILGELR